MKGKTFFYLCLVIFTYFVQSEEMEGLLTSRDLSGEDDYYELLGCDENSTVSVCECGLCRVMGLGLSFYQFIVVKSSLCCLWFATCPIFSPGRADCYRVQAAGSQTPP